MSDKGGPIPPDWRAIPELVAALRIWREGALRSLKAKQAGESGAIIPSDTPCSPER